MSEPAAPAAPRPAASLLVLRQAGAGPEVLMGQRGAGHKFMPNRLVFPGGAVDPEDFSAPSASPLRADVLATVGSVRAIPRSPARLASPPRANSPRKPASRSAPRRISTASTICAAP